MTYTDPIRERIADLEPGDGFGADAVGAAANFECGSFVRFWIGVDETTNKVERLAYRSNGCGYMLAAADLLRQSVLGLPLRALHGLDESELGVAALGSIPAARQACVAAALEALRNSFSELRRQRIEEFAGERALICTCFGVSEDAIEAAVEKCRLTSIEEIGSATNAGTGCGSCRMLLQEIIDARG